MNETVLDAKHVVHISLSEGLDWFWPFGQSILEMIFKVFKQKELLEDAVLIYRTARAPERRVFKIDVGNMPSHMAMAFVERVKNEIHQRRIPSNTGGGSGSQAMLQTLADVFGVKVVRQHTRAAYRIPSEPYARAKAVGRKQRILAPRRWHRCQRHRPRH
jgi:hypothetical protein